MASRGQLWRVIGGSQQGGIIVRDGRGLDSYKQPERLATGAVVEEQELLEERLHYRKLEGAGPKRGWVSTRLKGRDLLMRVPDSEASQSEVAQAPGQVGQDPTHSVERAVHALPAEHTGQKELPVPILGSIETDAASVAEGALPTQESTLCRESQGNSSEVAAAPHADDEVAEATQSLPALIEPVADLDESDLGQPPQSHEHANRRPDQINRGNFWFNFDDMSSDDDAESPARATSSPLSDSVTRPGGTAPCNLGDSGASPVTGVATECSDQVSEPATAVNEPTADVDDCSMQNNEPNTSEDNKPTTEVSKATAEVNEPTISDEPPKSAEAPAPSEETTVEQKNEKAYEAAKNVQLAKEAIPQTSIYEKLAEHTQLAKDLVSKVHPFLHEPVLCSDSDGEPRGQCLNCNKCKACRLDHRPYLCWTGSPLDWGQAAQKPSYRTGDKVEVRDKLGEDWVPGLVIASAPTVLVRPQHWNASERNFLFIRPPRAADALTLVEHCQSCGCASTAHEKLWEWKMNVEVSLGRFRNTGRNTKKKLPERSCVPRAALDWSPDDVAIFVLTAGVFDPRRDGRGPSLELGPSNEEPECESRGAKSELDSSDAQPEPETDPGIPKPEPDVQREKSVPKPSGAKTEPDPSDALLVSVVTPTSHKRHAFHPLLYKVFCNQTYEPKELIIVDTGDAPSTFLQERAKEDTRLVYRWFHVRDSRQQNLAECLIEPPAENNNTGFLGKGIGKFWTPPGKGKGKGLENMSFKRSRFHLNGKVRGGVPVEGWTLGMKRNLACHLAKGPIIAHFDDDDLYAPCYLEVMASRLCQAVGYQGNKWESRYLPAGAATLQDWHVFDFVDKTFGFVSPLTDPLVEEHMREPYAYGFGFSYIYTRAAWEMVMFADVEWSEDGHFVQDLLGSSRPVRLIPTKSLAKTCDALAAHSYHSDTTSGGEFVDFQVNSGFNRRAVTRSVRMGQKVETPESLRSLLPLAFQVAQQAGLQKGSVHPLRQQLSELPVGPEVSLDQKQFFMHTDVGREISLAAANSRRPQAIAGRTLNQFGWRPPQPGLKGLGRGSAWEHKLPGGGANWPGAGRGAKNVYAGGKGGFVPLWRRN